ncbi:MAG: S24 family peptidase, partial [Hyphomicrobium sp.]|nr:S24 family peptidase [Hyphomicrobium sp.]
DVVVLSLYGVARCGPGGSILDGAPVDRIPIASRLLSFPAAEAFMMRAKGNSMAPRISEGDLVIARRTSEVRDGHVYVCVNEEECLIKTVRRLGEKVLLESFNREEYPIFEAANDFRVEGEVRQILSGKI